MMSVWGWIADLILAVLLTGTLVMAVRLDRALTVVRRDRAVFEALITNLGSATNSVKLGIQALRNEADRAAEQIERRSEDADKLATDLSFLIDAANRAGERLEEGRQVAAARPSTPAPRTSNAEAKRHTGAQATGAETNQAGGLRELVGIGQRRRSRTQGGSARQADLPAPTAGEAVPAVGERLLGEPATAFAAMEG
jgi:Domain of unknown function (DUF6468)